MNVLIVEDETYAAERLVDQIHQYDRDIEVLSVIDSVEEATDFISSNKKLIDLAFLDIQLADGKSFEIFKHTDFLRPVIFTTAFDEYALDAFKMNSIDYLLKPIKYVDLQKALDKWKKIGPSDKTVVSQELVEQLLKEKRDYKKRFVVKFGSHIQFKQTDDIALFRADDRLCHIVEAKTGRLYIIDHTLEELENGLLDPSRFFRINRKYIVNIKAIKDIKMLASNQYEVFISTPYEEKLTVSRNRIKNFKNWIDA